MSHEQTNLDGKSQLVIEPIEKSHSDVGSKPLRDVNIWGKCDSPLSEFEKCHQLFLYHSGNYNR